jgi:hypothetical protein
MNIQIKRAKDPGARRLQYIIDGWIANFAMSLGASMALMLADTDFGWLFRYIGIVDDGEACYQTLAKTALLLQRPEADTSKFGFSDWPHKPSAVERFPDLRVRDDVIEKDAVNQFISRVAVVNSLATTSPRIAELPMLGIGNFISAAVAADGHGLLQVAYGSSIVFAEAVIDELEEYAAPIREELEKADEKSEAQ